MEETDSFTFIGTAETAYEFYATAYQNALNYLYQYDQAYSEAYQTCSFYLNLEKVLGIVISGTLVYLVMPLILKKGKTIGKLIFKLSLSLDSKEYQKIHFAQLLTRYLSIVFIEILGSQVFYYIPMMISLGTMMFTKRNFAIHDFIARTYVVDDVMLQEEERIRNEVNSNNYISNDEVKEDNK